MPQAQRTVVINRPPEEVFAFFADPAHDQQWRPAVQKIQAEGPMGSGTRIHQVVRGPGGRGIPADLEVTAYEPPHRYAFRATAGPVRPTGEYNFAPDSGATTITYSLTAELSGLKKLFMSRAVQSSMNSEMAALDKAKSLLEHD